MEFFKIRVHCSMTLLPWHLVTSYDHEAAWKAFNIQFIIRQYERIYLLIFWRHRVEEAYSDVIAYIFVKHRWHQIHRIVRKSVTINLLSCIEIASTPEEKSNLLFASILSKLCTILNGGLSLVDNCSQSQSIVPSLLYSKLHRLKSEWFNLIGSFVSLLLNVASV